MRVGDTCKNGHIIKTEGELVYRKDGTVICRRCAQWHNRASKGRKRAKEKRPPRMCRAVTANGRSCKSPATMGGFCPSHKLRGVVIYE